MYIWLGASPNVLYTDMSFIEPYAALILMWHYEETQMFMAFFSFVFTTQLPKACKNISFKQRLIN